MIIKVDFKNKKKVRNFKQPGTEFMREFTREMQCVAVGMFIGLGTQNALIGLAAYFFCRLIAR